MKEWNKNGIYRRHSEAGHGIEGKARPSSSGGTGPLQLWASGQCGHSSRALLQGASALTTFQPLVSPIEMQTLDGGSDWARLGRGPNRVVRDMRVVIDHLPEATGAQGNWGPPPQGKDARQRKPVCGSHTPQFWAFSLSLLPGGLYFLIGLCRDVISPRELLGASLPGISAPPNLYSASNATLNLNFCLSKLLWELISGSSLLHGSLLSNK